jgi:hypothetical protein
LVLTRKKPPRPVGGPSWSCPECEHYVTKCALYVYVPGMGWTDADKLDSETIPRG